ncbi:MAG TPA: DUF559 domain-containing protein [Dyella sp.]|uniref:endonuclease domain-containing protein n=1 Tax=Dyella sp. TaxID=1869338 RepID=UPI002D78669A|nr:DUF559 domain-containing protein [Dyella sp.]HET6554259.1 DUF559 domain-containing protein [Dyella sp.]
MQREWMRARKLRNEATDAERHLWRYLRREQLAGCKFRRQFPMGSYIVDFICVPARLVLELDGGQHLDAQAYDAARTLEIQARGYRVLRFWNDDVLLRTDAVLEEILRHLGQE